MKSLMFINLICASWHKLPKSDKTTFKSICFPLFLGSSWGFFYNKINITKERGKIQEKRKEVHGDLI